MYLLVYVILPFVLLFIAHVYVKKAVNSLLNLPLNNALGYSKAILFPLAQPSVLQG